MLGSKPGGPHTREANVLPPGYAPTHPQLRVSKTRNLCQAYHPIWEGTGKFTCSFSACSFTGTDGGDFFSCLFWDSSEILHTNAPPLFFWQWIHKCYWHEFYWRFKKKTAFMSLNGPLCHSRWLMLYKLGLSSSKIDHAHRALHFFFFIPAGYVWTYETLSPRRGRPFLSLFLPFTTSQAWLRLGWAQSLSP